ncbi:hypothetical protein Pan153_24270 [Gimesia panareensis]|uniref:Uncharacterized protein n=1 Tax=Gimesia panareensis TaxID=2527978 RepID=A0A518FN46_9PLAN|nr:hypothetical protein [Gimesia panareensis]QDV17772.1 hypothetical protein Pan153_24270 [Gimesia panareensis]
MDPLEDIKALIQRCLDGISSLKTSEKPISTKPTRGFLLIGMILSILLIYLGLFISNYIPPKYLYLITFHKQLNREDAKTTESKDSNLEQKLKDQSEILQTTISNAKSLQNTLARIESKLDSRQASVKINPTISKPNIQKSEVKNSSPSNNAPVFSTSKKSGAPIFSK